MWEIEIDRRERASARGETYSTENSAKNPSLGSAGAREALARLEQYRAGGEGERAMKTLLKMVSNVVEKSAEPKFRTIKCDNDAFRKRVSSFSGGIAMLKAAGFRKDELENTLTIADDELDVALPHARAVMPVLQSRLQ